MKKEILQGTKLASDCVNNEKCVGITGEKIIKCKIIFRRMES